VGGVYFVEGLSIVLLGPCLLRPSVLRDFFQQRLGSLGHLHRAINDFPPIGILAIHQLDPAVVPVFPIPLGIIAQTWLMAATFIASAGIRILAMARRYLLIRPASDEYTGWPTGHADPEE
jgi:hypothetical protein